MENQEALSAEQTQPARTASPSHRFRTIRNRLRNPPNAVKDEGIDLTRTKLVPLVRYVDAPPIEPPAPPPEWMGELVEFNEQLRRLCGVVDSEPIYLPPKVYVVTIVDVVAKHYGISATDIFSKRRDKWVVLPRHVAIYLARQLTLRSLPDLGKRFGGRDHTSCLHAIRKIEGLRASDPQLDQTLRLLEGALSTDGNPALLKAGSDE